MNDYIPDPVIRVHCLIILAFSFEVHYQVCLSLD